MKVLHLPPICNSGLLSRSQVGAVAQVHHGRRLLLRPPQRRTFLPNPLSSFVDTPKQTLTASRTLSYPSKDIYRVIADVESYSKFLPFCTSSQVTRWSAPDAATGQKWPSEAQLVVGWKGVEERFTSRIFCVPGKVVEAVSGETDTTLPREDVKHHAEGERTATAPGEGSSVLTQLLTRWTVKEAQTNANAPATNVDLAIEFQFANPVYSAMSSAVADKVASYMIEAFEDRVKALLERQR